MGEGKHLYGVIMEREKKDFGLIGVGEQNKIYTINHQDLAAVVSNSAVMTYDAVPKEAIVRYLASHQYVIEQVMKQYTTIPIKFGTIVRDEEEVKKALKIGQDQFLDALKEMDNKIELDVVATWANLDSILKEIGEKEPIKKFRREAAGKPSEQVEAAKIELGKRVKSALDDRRANTALEIVDELKEIAIDYWPHDVMDDSMIMNVAFLILKNKEGEFDQAVNRLNERFQDKVNFRCVGPLPPYSFRTMEIKKMNYQELNDARIALELGEEASLSEIKESYRRLAAKFHPDQRPGDGEAQKRFEHIIKAYRLLLDYCQKETCSFKEEEVRDPIIVKVLEI